MNLIAIELTPREATFFRVLMEAGVFDIKSGSVTLNFDAEGTLTEIRGNVPLYKRGYPHT